MTLFGLQNRVDTYVITSRNGKSMKHAMLCLHHVYLIQYGNVVTTWKERFDWRSFLTLFYIGRFMGGAKDAVPPGPKFFYFHAVFGTKNLVFAPPQGLAPRLGNPGSAAVLFLSSHCGTAEEY